MAVRKIKNTWWVDFMFDYTRYRKRSPENSRAGAKAYEALLQQKLARGAPIDKIGNGAQQGQTFAEFTRRWFDEYVVPNNKQQEQRMKKYILRSALIPFFGKIPLGQITTHHVEQYKAQALKKGVSKKTVNNRLAVLSKCLNSAYEWLQLPGALPKIKWLKCPPPPTNYLSADECELLLSNAGGVVREVMLVALRTGMRQGEIRGLQWSSIDWENRSITVRHSLNDRIKKLESPKNNRERHIPMDIDVYEALFRRKKDTGYVFLAEGNTPFDSQRIIRQLNKVREKAGLRKFTWHSLRHTFASHLAMKGAPLHVVQALLGHSTIIMTMRYAHVAPSALRAAIDLLNPKRLLDSEFRQPVVNQWPGTPQEEIAQKIHVHENARVQATE
ncbi:MAG: tyrosine-type recombinase/integrase [bacterium]|nr:tyrosine-type recombinase/integrase [bacterium]